MTVVSSTPMTRAGRSSLLRLLFGTLVCTLLLNGCRDAAVEQVETTAPVPVTVDTARVETLQGLVNAAGTVVAAPGAELTVVAPAPARIAELPKAEGDVVREGDVLARFDIPSFTADLSAKRAAVAQATARLDNARANFTRLAGLLSQGVAAQRDVDDARRQQTEAEADLDQAKSAAEAATAFLDRAVVRATFPGVVSKRFHNPGDLVDASASDPVLKVLNPDTLQIVAAVPVADLGRIVAGRAATVFDTGSAEGSAARVLASAPQVDSGNATANVRLAFVRQTRLAAGTPVRVEIVAEERLKALVVPAAAIVEEDSDTFVMVAGPDNKAHKYPIAAGLIARGRAEITSGLKAGDRVIVRGQDGLPEGAAVTVEP